MPLKSYKICSKIFEHGFDPPLLNNVQKNCGFGEGGHPLSTSQNNATTFHKVSSSPIAKSDKLPQETFMSQSEFTPRTPQLMLPRAFYINILTSCKYPDFGAHARCLLRVLPHLQTQIRT